MPLPEALAVFDPTVVAVVEAVPGWVWARCLECQELRLQRRAKNLGRCLVTSGCRGQMAVYLEALCEICGRPVTARRRGLDIRFCSKKCERGAVAA